MRKNKAASALPFRHAKEIEAVEWAKACCGKTWQKDYGVDLATSERTFPYPNLRFHCARPFGRKDWNIHVQWLRRLLNRHRMLNNSTFS